MIEKILCPYCGQWNGHPNGVLMASIGDRYGRSIKRFFCPECNAMSPLTKTGMGGAVDAAMRRFTPMQMPLTLDEVASIIWCRTNLPPMVYVETKVFAVASGWRSYKDFCDHLDNMCDTYGKAWRAWAHKPTDEERAAANWEEYDGN